MDMPDEVLLHIMKPMTQYEAIHFSSTCKRINYLFHDKEMWQYFEMKGTPIHSSALGKLFVKHSDHIE